MFLAYPRHCTWPSGLKLVARVAIEVPFASEINHKMLNSLEEQFKWSVIITASVLFLGVVSGKSVKCKWITFILLSKHCKKVLNVRKFNKNIRYVLSNVRKYFFGSDIVEMPESGMEYFFYPRILTGKPLNASKNPHKKVPGVDDVRTLPTPLGLTINII